MAGFLQKLFDQVNPFDNGKSFSNQNPRPASTAQPRNVAQKAFDQVNPFDNGKSWNTAQPTTKKALWQQALDNPIINPLSMVDDIKIPGLGVSGAQIAQQVPQATNQTLVGTGNVAAMVAPPVVKTLNTGLSAAKGVYDLGNVGVQSLVGSDTGYNQARQQLQRTINSAGSTNSGIGGIGGWTSGKDRSIMDGTASPLEFAGKIASAGAEASPYFLGAAGAAAPEASLGAKLFAAAKVGAPTSLVGSLGQQYSDTGRIDAGKTAEDTAIGTLMNVAGEGAGHAIGNVLGKITTKLVPKAATAIEDVTRNVDMPTTSLVPKPIYNNVPTPNEGAGVLKPRTAKELAKEEANSLRMKNDPNVQAMKAKIAGGGTNPLEETYYRGTTKKNDVPTFMTKNKEMAADFAEGGAVQAYKVNKNDILDISNPEHASMVAGVIGRDKTRSYLNSTANRVFPAGDPAEEAVAKDLAKKLGFKAVRFDEARAGETLPASMTHRDSTSIAIVDPDHFTKSKQSRAIPQNAPKDPLEALKAEARKYKSADEFVNSQVSRPKTTDNVWQDTLPSGTRPDSIKKVTKSGGNPLYHDTTADGVLGILDSGEIKASQAPFSSIAGQGKRVSTTRNFDNYSRYNKSPYRLVIDESKTGQRAIPDNREEFESIFRKGVSTKAVNSVAIDTTNPALLDDIRSGKLKNVIESAKKKGITIEPFEGKVLPNEGANAEVQTMTSRAFSEAFPEYRTRISQLTDLYNQATKPNIIKDEIPKSWTKPKTAFEQNTGVVAPTRKTAPVDTQAYIQQQTRLQEVAAKGERGSKLTKVKNELSTKGIDALSAIEKPVEIAAGGRKNTVALRNQLDRSLRADTIAGQYAKDNGLHNIVNSVDDTKAFDQYLIARHGQDLTANGIKTGRDAAQDSRLLKDLSPKYEAQAKALGEYNNKLLDKTAEYGLISKETASYLKEKYPNYVPFDRIFSEGELSGVGNGAGPASLSTQTIIQRIKGSDRQVGSPLESILAKTRDIHAQGERNLAAQQIVATAKLPGNPLGIVPLRTAENVKARIDLYTQAKELKPVQSKLSRLERTRKGWANSLQSEINKLNKTALNKSLKASGSEPLPSFSPEAMGTFNTKSRDMRSFVNSFINRPSSEIQSLKNKIATRDNKLGPVLDELSSISDALQGVKATRSALFDEAKLHADAQAKGMATISTIRDGIKEIYQTTPEVAQAAKSLNRQQLGVVEKVLSYPTRALRLGATGVNIGFAGANVVKDAASAFINSEHPLQASIANPKVFVKALSAAFHHGGKAYGELVREGAGGTSFDIARNAAKESIGKIRSERNGVSKILHTVKSPSELLRAVEDTIGRSEEFGRAVQYFGNKGAALKEGKTLAEATAYGADAARNNTVNFARAGEYGRVVNSVLPYVNAGVQGSRALMRNVRDRPAQTASKIAIMGFFPVAVTTAYALSDPKRKAAYDDIQDYEKQGNIIIVPPNPVKDPKTGRWNVIKIPVSQEIANLNNIVRNGIESLQKDKGFDFAAMAGELAGTATSINFGSPRQALGQVIPQGLKPAIETLTNKNLFTGNNVVPKNQLALDAKDQYGDYTSGTARTIGNVTGTSPRQIDNLIRTSFGGAGQTAVNASDNLLAKTGVIKPEDIRGMNLGTSVSNRFNSAAGLSEYAAADKAIEDKTKQLKATAEYKALDPADKASALQRLTQDVFKANKLAIDAKSGKPGWGTDKNGKQIKLSERQAGLLDGKTDIKDYLTTNAQKEAAGISTSTTKASNPKERYEEALDKFNKDDKEGKISEVNRAGREKEITKLNAQKDYSKDTVDLYGKSFKEMVSFVNTNNNGKKYWEEIKALDKAMVDAGYTSKLYNKNGSLKATSTAAKGKKAKKGKFDYSKRLATSQSDFAAIRNLVKRPKYSRKKVTIS